MKLGAWGKHSRIGFGAILIQNPFPTYWKGWRIEINFWKYYLYIFFGD